MRSVAGNKVLFSFAITNAVLLTVCEVPADPPTDYKGVVAEEEWTVLHRQLRARGTRPLPREGKLTTVDDLVITGPRPGHPFVLGNYAPEGHFGLVDGYIQMISGKEAALDMCWADEFELEGIMDQDKYGGWFFIIGYDAGHGYIISNVNMIESGSPWFVTEIRGNKSIEGKTTEYDDFFWKREQSFLMKVVDQQLTLKVGKFDVLDVELPNYKPGRIVFGIYETKYGTKPIRIKSLRVREQPAEQAEN